MMDVKEIKKELRKQLSVVLGESDKLTEKAIREKVNKIFNYWAQQGIRIVDESIKKVATKELCDDFLGWGPLQQVMNDPDVTEIMINNPDTIYVEKNGKKVVTDIKFDDEAHLRYITEKMLMPTGRRVDESFPYVDFALKDGSRVNVIIPPLSVDGSAVTIRKFLTNIASVEDLIKLGTIDQRMSDFLVACIKAKINVLFSGATGTGKTTTLEVLSSYIDPGERVITIEDALEITLKQKHVVRLLTRPANIEGRGEVSIRDLFINTLRMRPTRIILGEIRGKEAMDYLQALNSGHNGCLGVIHASSPMDVLTRLETMALYAGINIPVWAIREQMASGIDLIVQHEQLQDGSRKITYITEAERLEKEAIILKDIFRYKIEKVDKDGKVTGSFEAKNTPSFMYKFRDRGVKVDEKIFKEQ